MYDLMNAAAGLGSIALPKPRRRPTRLGNPSTSRRTPGSTRRALPSAPRTHSYRPASNSPPRLRATSESPSRPPSGSRIPFSFPPKSASAIKIEPLGSAVGFLPLRSSCSGRPSLRPSLAACSITPEFECPFCSRLSTGRCCEMIARSDCATNPPSKLDPAS